MSHEAVYTRVLCPRDKQELARHRSHAALEAHQTQAASTWRVLRTHPVRGDGQHWLTAPRMWMIVGPLGHWQVWPEHFGNLWHLSGSDPGRA